MLYIEDMEAIKRNDDEEYTIYEIDCSNDETYQLKVYDDNVKNATVILSDLKGDFMLEHDILKAFNYYCDIVL